MDETRFTLKRLFAIAVGITAAIVILAWSSGATGSKPAAAQFAPTSSTTSSLPATTTTSTLAVAPSATPTTSPAVEAVGCYGDLAAHVGWPAADVAHVTYLIQRESHCDPNAWADRPSTGDDSIGLLQINTIGDLWPAIQEMCGVTDRHQLTDPTTNLTCGLRLFERYGFQPWGG